MNTDVPKEIKKEQMSLKHKKYFCNLINSGASWLSFNAEHKRIFKRTSSRSTFQRLKRDSKTILEASTHRAKRINYKTKNLEEKNEFELHVKETILNCYRRQFVIKLTEEMVHEILITEAKKFSEKYQWLDGVKFSNRYIRRFLEQHELIYSAKKSDQTYIPADQMDIHRIVI